MQFSFLLFPARYVYKLNTYGRAEIESCVRLMAYGGLTANLVRPDGLTRKRDAETIFVPPARFFWAILDP